MVGTPIFSFIFRFGALFLVKNFNAFGSMKICGFFFGGGGGRGRGHYEIGFFFEGVISIHFRAF